MKKRNVFYLITALVFAAALVVFVVNRLQPGETGPKQSTETTKPEEKTSGPEISEPKTEESSTETESGSETETEKESETEKKSETETEIGTETETGTDESQPVDEMHVYDLDFTVKPWPEGSLPALEYVKPGEEFGEMVVTVNETYRTHESYRIDQYAPYFDIHRGRFEGREINVDMAREIIITYTGAEVEEIDMLLDHNMSKTFNCAVWHAYFDGVDSRGNEYRYRVNLFQYGNWDCLYLISIPKGAYGRCRDFVENSLAQVTVREESY